MADAPVANTEMTRSGWSCSRCSRSRGTIRRLAAASASSASRFPGRSAVKWNASYRPGTASIPRNTASPTAPPRRPSSRIASSVWADQPDADSEAVHASASWSCPMPIDPVSSSAFRRAVVVTVVDVTVVTGFPP